FCWRGFLYYKWVLDDLNAPIARVISDIETTQPRGPKDPEATAYIPGARARILAAIEQTRSGVTSMLGVYDKTYAALTEEGKPSALREFLLAAPEMFTRLGEQLGALQHIDSFWRYRFNGPAGRLIGPTELMDVLLDFEDSLAFTRSEAAVAA